MLSLPKNSVTYERNTRAHSLDVQTIRSRHRHFAHRIWEARYTNLNNERDFPDFYERVLFFQCPAI